MIYEFSACLTLEFISLLQWMQERTDWKQGTRFNDNFGFNQVKS